MSKDTEAPKDNGPYKVTPIKDGTDFEVSKSPMESGFKDDAPKKDSAER